MSSTGFGKQRQGPGAGAVRRRRLPGSEEMLRGAGGGPWSWSVLRMQNLARGLEIHTKFKK